MVSGHIGRVEVRGQFELAGGDFIVMGFGRDSETEELVFEVLHKDLDAFGNRAEVVVVEFLALW